MIIHTLGTLTLFLVAGLSPALAAEEPKPTETPHTSPTPTTPENDAALNQKVGTTIGEGADSVTLVGPDKAERAAAKGDVVSSGTRVKVKPGKQATLVSSDGTQIILSNEADFEPGEKKDEVQTHTLHAGKVKTSVPHSPTPAEKIEGAKKKIHFLIRTKSAVIGVRGTIFEVLMQGLESARVETMEGVVEVAKDEGTLLTQGGTQVPAGQFVTATPEGISVPQAAPTAAPVEGSLAPGAAATPALPPGAPAQSAAPAAAIGAASGLMPSFHIFSFEAGGLVAPDPAAGPLDSPKASPFLAWKPGIGLPKLDFVRLRAHLSLAKRESFIIRDLGFFLTVHAIGLAFAELGWGSQSWGNQASSGSTFSTNAGLLTGGVFVDRIFVGRTTYSFAQTSTTQWRAGLGFHF